MLMYARKRVLVIVSSRDYLFTSLGTSVALSVSQARSVGSNVVPEGSRHLHELSSSLLQYHQAQKMDRLLRGATNKNALRTVQLDIPNPVS